MWHHWTREWLGACTAPSRYLNQRSLPINHAQKGRLQTNIIETYQFPLTKLHLNMSSAIFPRFVQGGDQLIIATVIHTFWYSTARQINEYEPRHYVFHCKGPPTNITFCFGLKILRTIEWVLHVYAMCVLQAPHPFVFIFLNSTIIILWTLKIVSNKSILTQFEQHSLNISTHFNIFYNTRDTDKWVRMSYVSETFVRKVHH